jgi:hypothetical protein
MALISAKSDVPHGQRQRAISGMSGYHRRPDEAMDRLTNGGISNAK